MARKQIRVSRRMLFTWFTLAGFIFLFSPSNLTNKFQLTFHGIFNWPLTIGRNVSLSADTRQPLGDKDLVSRDEHERLLNHLANVIQQRNDAYEEVTTLSKMRNIPNWERMGFVPADVITVSIDELRSELIINRGQDDGLAKDQFVLAYNSVIGTISDVDARTATARVKLFTDPTSNIAVKIATFNMDRIMQVFTDPASKIAVKTATFNIIDRIMQGSGNSSAKVQLVPTKYEIEIGNIVYAQKKPGFLSTPVIVGTVAECKSNDENPLVWDITVEPVCNIQKAENVVVIVMNPPEVR